MPKIMVRGNRNVKTIDVDYTADLLIGLQLAKNLVADKMATEFKQDVVKTVQQQGSVGGQSKWPPKSGAAIEKSGNSTSWVETGELIQNLAVKESITDIVTPDRAVDRFVGWDDKIHVETGLAPSLRKGQLTLAKLASVLEFGHISEGGQLTNTGLFVIPPRPLISRAADAFGDSILQGGQVALLIALRNILPADLASLFGFIRTMK